MCGTSAPGNFLSCPCTGPRLEPVSCSCRHKRETVLPKRYQLDKNAKRERKPVAPCKRKAMRFVSSLREKTFSSSTDQNTKTETTRWFCFNTDLVRTSRLVAASVYTLRNSCKSSRLHPADLHGSMNCKVNQFL